MGLVIRVPHFPLGGGAATSFPITLADGYNNRLQPMTIAASIPAPPGTATPPTPPTGPVQWLYNHTLSYSPTGNNGNLLLDVDNVTTGNSAMYTYDTLNRITLAQAAQVSQTPSTATLTIAGSEGSSPFSNPCPQYPQPCPTIYDQGGDSVSVNGVAAGGFGWNQTTTDASSLAANLASNINATSSSPVTATSSGSSVTLTSKISGIDTNYPIAISSTWSSSSYFSSPSFTVSGPNTLSGGTSGATPASGGWNEANSYDPFGNLYQKTDASAGSQIGFSATQIVNNQIHIVQSGIDQITYDLSGNVTKDNFGTQYTWDAESRMASSAGNGGSLTYGYDGDGKRVLKYNPGNPSSLGSVYWYGADGSMTDETTVALNGSNPKDLQRNFYFDGKLIARQGFPDVFYPSYFVISDQLGSSRATVDFRWLGSGAHGPTYTNYFPFGGYITPPTSTLDQEFTGKERDSESGNDYFGARYYASSMGRWMSPDPGKITRDHLASPQKWNKYNYVLNNPLAMVDLDGKVEVTIVYRAFIPQAQVFGFRGDNRSFSTDPKASSRVTVTMRIETDPAKNGGHPLLSSDYQVGTTHFNPTGSEKKSAGPALPTVTPSQGKDGNVTLNVNMNMRDPYQPIGQGAASNVNISVNEQATSAEVKGTVSGAPSFEANITPEGSSTTNIPVQESPTSTAGFLYGLQTTNTVDKTKQLTPPACQQSSGCSH